MPFKSPEDAKRYGEEYRARKRLEKEANKEESQSDKEIVFPEGEEPINEINIEEEDIEDKKEIKKGRPPKDKNTPPTKPKMKYNKDTYKTHPATKTFNFIIKNSINRFVLKTNEKLTDADMEGFGEALAYTLDYYLPKGGMDPNHPIVVLGFASFSMGIKIMELKSKPEKPKEANEKDPTKIGVEPGAKF
jgi:hypothetical protein